MEEIISKKELDELKKIKGMVRGTVFKESKEFVFKEEGKEGIQRLEDAMASLNI